MKKKLVLFGILAAALLVGYFFLSKQRAEPLVVLSTVPKNGTQFVDTKAEVVVTLNRSLSPEEENLLRVQVSPDAKVDIVYQGNNIRISPETEYKVDTKHEITISFKESVLYLFGFTTFPFTQQQLQEDGAKQSAADLAFGEKYKDFLTNYPWYPKIPIETSEYRIVYDFEASSFRIRLKMAPKDESSKEGLVNKALDDLKSIGVPEPIDYHVVVGE